MCTIILGRRVRYLISLALTLYVNYENVKEALCSQHKHLLISEFMFDLRFDCACAHSHTCAWIASTGTATQHDYTENSVQSHTF